MNIYGTTMSGMGLGITGPTPYIAQCLEYDQRGNKGVRNRASDVRNMASEFGELFRWFACVAAAVVSFLNDGLITRNDYASRSPKGH